MEQKKYMNIERLKPVSVDSFEVGDHIIVQEKIDGANFSIRYDSSDDTIKSFSRKKVLDFKNNLRGAWNWSQTLDIELFKSIMGDNLILFMEWLVPHSVKYPDDKYNHAYCYDIYDIKNDCYLKQDVVKEAVRKLGLIYVPVFYDGKFITWENLNAFVGKTYLGGSYGEGVVVKNMTKLNNPNNRLPFYTKIVCKQFAETKEVKPIDTKKIALREECQKLTSSIVTKARVNKLINKMADNGIITVDWNEHDMGTIAKNLGKEVYYDCKKEEPDVVELAGEMFGKLASSTALKITRDILSEKLNANF